MLQRCQEEAHCVDQRSEGVPTTHLRTGGGGQQDDAAEVWADSRP